MIGSVPEPLQKTSSTTDDIPIHPALGTLSASTKLARRAKSYSAFYDIVQSHLRKSKPKHTNAEINSAATLINSQADYERWAASSSAVLIDRANSESQAYLDQLTMMVAHLDSVLESTDSALDLLSSLSLSFKNVEKETTKFQNQSEGYVSEHARLIKLADEIAENVQYYLYLEPISRKLNDPKAGDHVGDKDFADTLLLLDQCLAYMAAHPEQRDARSFGSRYRQLLTRALILIRGKFTSFLREIANDVTRRIADRQLNDTTMSTLLYAKFRVGAPEMKRLGSEIQKRVSMASDLGGGIEVEYQRLMNELFQSYASTRGRLVSPLVTKKLGEMALSPSISKDLVTFAQNTINYLKMVCMDEHELWNEWFGVEGTLYDFLESVCEPWYDHLRPRIIHETRIVRLCEVCTFIQTTYFDTSDSEDGGTTNRDLDFGRLIQPALQDAQSRLVFLALNILRNDIEYFKPTPDELDYPARLAGPAKVDTTGPVLSGTRSKHALVDTAILDAEGGVSMLEPNAAPETWYPTLRRAVWLLSRIYRLVNSTIFDDLARQILHQTTSSFVRAAKQISEKQSPIDSSLFLIKHLLLLKQHIASFDLESGAVHPPEVEFDFSGLASTFWSTDWLRMPGKLVSALIRGEIGNLIPIVVQDYRSAKDEVDDVLRSSIGAFVEAYANRMTVPLTPGAAGGGGDITKVQDGAEFIAQIEKKAAAAGGGGGRHGRMRNGAVPAALCESVMKAIPELRSRLDQYLSDARTKEMLVAAVMEQVCLTYEKFWLARSKSSMTADGGAGASAGQLTAKSGGSMRIALSTSPLPTPLVSPTAGTSGKSLLGPKDKGKDVVVDIWSPTEFSDWCECSFGVGTGLLGDERYGTGHADEDGDDGDDDRLRQQLGRSGTELSDR